jgi:hypothetical protein
MLRAILRNSGVRPRRLAAAIRGWRRYVRDRATFRRLSGARGMPWGDELPMLTEWDEPSGGLGAYFFQDLCVARWIREDNPLRHVDVGSRIDGFIGHLAVFREVEVIDIRPPPGGIPGVAFHQLDLMEELPEKWVGSTDSLSCLHTIEHFGLGRYGDPLDPAGHLKGLDRLKRMVKPGGVLYVSTPIGPERVEFNAHRVFAAKTLIGWFADGWSIERFAVVGDDVRLRENVEWQGDAAETHFGCQMGVGILAARRSAGT